MSPQSDEQIQQQLDQAIRAQRIAAIQKMCADLTDAELDAFLQVITAAEAGKVDVPASVVMTAVSASKKMMAAREKAERAILR